MLEKGCIVKSAAGHDKDRFYLVLEISGDRASIADGRERKLSRPKRKNVKHIRATNNVVDVNAFTTDKKLRELLAPFNNALKNGHKEGGN